ncbi:DUF2029 domain-containing protein [Candidatus Collierbacteria bacterium]|nr:DUF2029 domain-containing protein [Candidatus Collierbacteria bacterium]
MTTKVKMVRMVKWLKDFMAKRIILLIVAIILYRQVVPLANLVKNFPLNDFSVYIDGTKATLNGENPYKLKFFDRYNYSPATTLFFLPLAAAPTELSEWLFTVLSVVSLWLTVSMTLRILNFDRSSPSSQAERSVVEGSRGSLVIKWLIFTLCLKMFPVKLTLALGQINLIVLALIVGSYYFVTIRKKDTVSGILFGLATILKLTPAPILIYFLIRKKWKVVNWYVFTFAFLTVMGGFVFGWDLTKYYFVSVVPGLMGEVTKETVNASYMNQSITALIARFGVFGNLNSAIRLGISFILGVRAIRIIKIIKTGTTRNDFIDFWHLTIIVLLFLPVFVWQHHYTILIPVWIVLIAKFIQTKKFKDLAIVGLTYFLLIFYIKDPYLPLQLNPFLSSHFLTSGLIFLILNLKSFSSNQNQIPNGKKLLKQNSGSGF